MTTRYINPYTDFGFKKLFGEEANKDLLMDFLNQMLPEAHKIKSLEFRNTHHEGDRFIDRSAIFDIYCQAEDGQSFIVEMQKTKFVTFKERAIYYSTFPIKEQSQKGDWDFNLKPVYCVGILDFVFDKSQEAGVVRPDPYFSYVQLKDQDCVTFYDKLTFIFLEMPLFNKTEDQLETHFDKWLYFLKHLEDFSKIPAVLNEPVFRKGFQALELANLSPDQALAYEASLKDHRDRYCEKLAHELVGEKRGIAKGENKEKRNNARGMKEKGYPVEDIMEITGLSKDEIANL